MLQQGDLIVLFLLVGAIVAIAVRPLRMRAKSAVPWSESDGGFSGEVPVWKIESIARIAMLEQQKLRDDHSA